MFIGREAELKFLEDRYETDDGQLIVLYGRRRVGKTETLREFCKDKPHVFFSCTQTTDKVQLRNFSSRMFKEDIPARNYISEFEDWEKAFRAVLDLPYADKKKILVIDEFPYMPCFPRVDLMRRLSKRLTKIERHFMTLKQLLGLCDRNRNFIQGKFPEAGNGNGTY